MLHLLRLSKVAGLLLALVLFGVAAGVSGSRPVAAFYPPLLESAGYSFYANLPDPAAWTVSALGNVSEFLIDGSGLGMIDPDYYAQRMYVHSTPFLSGDPDNPNFDNTATFRVRSLVPYVSDGSSAWSAEAISWRIVLDDGSHRLELRLARSATYARQVRVENSTLIPPIDFPWDNRLANTYEIARLANGDFVLTLTNADPSSPNPVVSMTIPAGFVPYSWGTPQFAWGAGSDGGGSFYWQQAQVEVADPAAATVLESLDYEFSFNLPDPAVWSVSQQGSVSQRSVEGLGLGMVDPDNSSYLLYTHPTPFLSGDPNNPNFNNTATFRVRAVVPYIPDGSGWFADAISWQMILDDGVHRLALNLARTPTGNRTIRIHNAGFFENIPFHWDNDMANTYEISRLANGDFVVTLTSGDTSSPNPVVTLSVPAGMLPASHGQPLFAWGLGAEAGGAAYWSEVEARVFGPEVSNQVPVVGPITAPLDPVPVNSTVVATAPFADADPGDTHTAVWDWGDGSTSPGAVSEASGAGTVSGEHAYTAAGIYPVTLSVSDGDASASATFQYVVVYDPEGGFITGGGWIHSPAGAYAADPSLSGRANFGFNSKYKKGANVPTGESQFQFRAGDLNFYSSSYEWLVVAGARAKYKGTGTINGSGNYDFMLSAIDGQIKGGGGTDKFRIKIWDKTNGDVVVYDNQMGADEDAEPTTTLGGGSIVIHEARGKSVEMEGAESALPNNLLFLPLLNAD